MTTPRALGPRRPDAGGDDERNRRLAALERERDELRAALETSKANFRSAFHATPAGMSLSRVDSGKILDMNDAFLRILGFGREEVIGRTSAELNLWVTGTQRDALIGELRATGQVVAREVPMRRRDGAIVTVLFTAVPTVVGGEAHTITWVLDISERRRAEEALRENEARWRSLVTQAPAAISELDRDGTVLYINRSLTGRPAAEMIGRSIFGFVGEAAAAIGRVKLAEAFATGRTIRFDISMPTVGGGTVHAENTLAPMVIDGEVQRVIAVVTDTTAHVLARQALAESEQRLRDIVESMGDWLAETDLEWRVTYSSPQVEQLLGYTADEVRGASPLGTAAPEERARLAGIMAAFLEQGRPVRDVEVWHLRKDGERVCLSVSGVPLRDATGTVRGMRAVSHDVTGRKRAEEERRALEAKMQQAQKFESLGILAGGIAHDFNNLLTAVLGNADLALADLPPDAPARESVEQIQKASLHAAELTRQMLAYAGRGSISVQPVALRDLVHDMAQLLGSSISKRHALVLELAEPLPAVEADPAQLRQIVMNLVINASEAIGEREGAINVRTAALAPGEQVAGDLVVGDVAAGRRVLLEVADTGEGMDGATLPRVFDPFFSTKFAGRGLGLPVVAGIVRRHGGAVSVRSRRGAGCTFSVVLPASEDPRPAAAAAPGRGQPGAWRGSGTILLVDDEEPVRDMASRMLRAMGFGVLAAADGLEALATLEKHGGKIRAVLLDLTMPRIDGEETLRRIRATLPKLPVVLCSGYDVLERQGRFAELAPSGFVQKPFRLADLQAALRRALGEQAAGRTAAAP